MHRMGDEMEEAKEEGQGHHTMLYAVKTPVISPEIPSTVRWLES